MSFDLRSADISLLFHCTLCATVEAGDGDLRLFELRKEYQHTGAP